VSRRVKYDKQPDQIGSVISSERIKRYLEEVTFCVKHKRKYHYSLESNSSVSCKYGFAEQVTKSASKSIVAFIASDWRSVGRRKLLWYFSFIFYSYQFIYWYTAWNFQPKRTILATTTITTCTRSFWRCARKLVIAWNSDWV